MGLGLSYASGETASVNFLPRMDFNAKSGRMKFRQRVEVNGMWETQEKDVSFEQFVFIADLANTQVGWLFFKKGMAPVRAVVPHGQPIPPRPTGDFGVDEKGRPNQPKKGFVLRILDGDRMVREFASNAASVLGSMDELHDKFEAAPEHQQGMLPVVQFTGTSEIKSQHGTNYAPNFQIVKWVPRPAELPAGAPAATVPQSVAPAAPAPAATLPPPTPQASKPLPF